MTHPFARHDHKSSVNKRFPRLRLEQLEAKHLLTTISGHVIEDLNGNGIVEEGEPGQSLVRVYIDANGNDVFDQQGSILEPDRFPSGQPIDGSSIGATLSVVDEFNARIDNVGPVLANDDELAATGNLVFGWQENASWNPFFRLRVDFDQPISAARLSFIGESEIAGDIGVMEVYDTDNNLLETVETTPLTRGNSALLETTQSNISYVSVYTKRPGLTGRIDALQIDGQNAEIWTLTNGDGAYTLSLPTSGTYRVNEIAPENYQQTSPNGDGSHTVPVEEGADVENVNFTNKEVVNQMPIAIDDVATTVGGETVDIDVLQNDSDPDGTLDPSSVQIVTNASHGQAIANATTGEIQYTPNEGFNGQDQFTYRVADVLGLVSNEATVTINVSGNDIGSWQNKIKPMDVDDNGIIAPIDALYIINELNNPKYREPVTGKLPSVPPNPVPFYFDVDANGFVAPLDAILIINYLNSTVAPAARPAGASVAAAVAENESSTNERSLMVAAERQDDSSSDRRERVLVPRHVDLIFG